MYSAEEIKNLRKSRGLTQSGFAKILGVSRTTVSNWETNVNGVTPKHIKKINKFKENNK